MATERTCRAAPQLPLDAKRRLVHLPAQSGLHKPLNLNPEALSLNALALTLNALALTLNPPSPGGPEFVQLVGVGTVLVGTATHLLHFWAKRSAAQVGALAKLVYGVSELTRRASITPSARKPRAHLRLRTNRKKKERRRFAPSSFTRLKDSRERSLVSWRG